MQILNQIVRNPLGAFVLLALAAFLEVFGDSFFQAALYRSNGPARGWNIAGGIAVLAVYGLMVNLPRWDFGKLLGVYVVLFFVVAQVIAKLRFNESPTHPILAGGALILAGGAVIAFWK